MVLITFSLSTSGPTFTTTVQNVPTPITSISGYTMPNNAATAYDFFGTTGVSANNYGYLAANAVSVASPASAQNKQFALSICQQAKSAILPLYKAELFAGVLANAKTYLTASIQSAGNALTSLNTLTSDSSTDTATKTALAAAYTAELAGITAVLNRAKTLETKIYTSAGETIDNTSTGTPSVASLFNATATLAAFPAGTKTYLAQQLDPANLGNAGVAIPALTAATYANASALATIYTTAGTALGTANVATNFKAEYLTATKQIFDAHMIMLAGYVQTANNSGTTGAPVGLFAGIDYEVSTVGHYQTGSGAPSGTIILWGGETTAVSNHTW